MRGCRYFVSEEVHIDRGNFHPSYDVRYYCTKSGSYSRTSSEHCDRCLRNKGLESMNNG